MKNTLIKCQRCGQIMMVKPSDTARGAIACRHPGCGHTNVLTTQTYFDPAITQTLPSYGTLVYQARPTLFYPLRLGRNLIGVGADCDVRLERFLHDGQCFISRRHCTLDISFDKWTGRFRYRLQDGFVEPATLSHQKSLNGTRVQAIQLQPGELVDVPDGGLITLGGADVLVLKAYQIPVATLETYRITACLDPDSTQ